MNRPLGVGIIGAGAATQAIHLPTLATLANRFRVVHVMSANEGTAAAVAARVDARFTTRLELLLDDPAVDVVAICSPPQFHVEQVVAAAAAGKRAILCEKPLATTVEGGQRISDVSASTGVPVVVGTMHAYDPAWTAARPYWAELERSAYLVRSAIYLPPIDEFVGLATDPASPRAPLVTADGLTPELQAEMLTSGVLGLAIHAIPQIRHFLPRLERVSAVRLVTPFGYRFVLTADGRSAELTAIIPGQWAPEWTLHVWGADGELHVLYPPPYMLAGSATVTHVGPDGKRSWRYPTNGYQAEWTHLADVAEGRVDLAIPLQTVIDDLLFAVELAANAAASVLESA